MSRNYNGFGSGQLEENLAALAENTYPGRGIVQGLSEGGETYVQAYWVMGRSDDSRNRVLVHQDGAISTEARDPSKVKNPRLTIYPAMVQSRDGVLHAVSNGEQTSTVMSTWADSESRAEFSERFNKALLSHMYEPDAPNFTPRITAYIQKRGAAGYSVIRRDPLTYEPIYTYGWQYLASLPGGVGLCFHTYEGDGDPLPSFEGTPYAVPVQSTANETAEALWESLDQRNRVALAVKTICCRDNGVVDIRIINQLPSDQPT